MCGRMRGFGVHIQLVPCFQNFCVCLLEWELPGEQFKQSIPQVVFWRRAFRLPSMQLQTRIPYYTLGNKFASRHVAR